MGRRALNETVEGQGAVAGTDVALRGRAVRGAAWSGVSSIVLRMGSLVVGIVLARILTPDQFGVYAVALTVQSVLMTVADLGLSSELIRTTEPDRVAPTVATLGLVSGATMTLVTVVTSSQLALLLGSAQAGPAIAVLGCTLVLGSISLVPYSLLMRRFQQKAMFLVSAVDFTISTVTTLALVFAGWGVMGLAVGRVVAQLVSSALQFWLARVTPRYGFDRALIRPVLAFGLPIAAANLLAWSLLNIDNVVIAHISGTAALGFYVLAFNISSWPMNALAQSVRTISMPYFSRVKERGGGDDGGLAGMVSVGWAAALPAGAVLAILSEPLIVVLYGSKWLPSAPVLAALGMYGALRVIFDIFSGYLYASGRATPVMWVQVIWMVSLVAGMVPATMAFGISGAGWVHVVVAAGVILPAFGVLLHRAGVRVHRVMRRCLWPTLAAVPAIAVASACRLLFAEPIVALLVGGSASAAVYAAFVWPFARRVVAVVRSTS